MEYEPRIAVYPGTFDPMTNGHLSLIRRASSIFDRIVVGVANDTPKNPLFTIEERVAMAQEVLAGYSNVKVQPFSGMTVDFADQLGSTVIVRGLRAMSDFEYEFQLALINRRLKRHIQTVFLMTDYQWFYTSSTLIKAAAELGGDIRGLVPDSIYCRLREKFNYPNLLAE